jgi:hypothetical protein
MRWSERRDGAVAVYDDDTRVPDDMIVVEAVVEEFTPTHAGRCRCGAQLDFRRTAYGAEVFCFHCHTTLARIDLGTKVHQ